MQGDVGGSHRGSREKKNQPPQFNNKDQILSYLNMLPEPEVVPQKIDDIKILTLTWNMARKKQDKCDFNMLFPSTTHYDVIISCFQESKDRAGFIERLNKFMEQNGFKQMKTNHMYEMFIIAFIKKSK